FQAEDGIRDRTVTGVQTCALPISFVENDRAVRDQLIHAIEDGYYKKVSHGQLEQASLKGIVSSLHDPFSHYLTPTEAKLFRQSRSEERRVGKEWRRRWSA